MPKSFERAARKASRVNASVKGRASGRRGSVSGRRGSAGEGNAEARAHWRDIGQRVVVEKKKERKEWMKMLKGAVVEQKWGALLVSKQANEQILGSALAAVDPNSRFVSKEQQPPMPLGILHPSSPARLGWDVLSILLVAYITISLPFRLAFLSDEHSYGLTVFDFVIDVYFLVDMGINFRTAYVDDGELITSRVRIAAKYLKTWFVLDLCSSVPIEWFLFGVRFTPNEINETEVGDDGRTATQLASILKIFKVLKLLRLLRLARLLRYFSNWQEYISDNFAWLNSNVMRLIKLSLIMLVTCHWNACIQFFVADLSSYPADSWVVRGGLKAEGGEPIDGMDAGTQYSYSFFCAGSQMLALDAWNGAGDFRPIMVHELWTNLFSIVLGSMLYALLVASLTAVISESDPAARAYRAKVDTVNHYMRYAQLPRPMRSKIRDYLELAYPSKCSFDEDAILNELTGPLRQEVHLHKCGHVLDTLHVVHTGGDPGMPGAIAHALHGVVFVVGDYILRQGTRPDGMYFLSAGTVDVVTHKQSDDSPSELLQEKLITVLSAGSFFGEMALLSNSGRAMASIRASTSVEGHYLSRKNYQQLIADYPAFKTYLSTVASLRLESREERGKKVRASRWRKAIAHRDELAHEAEAERAESLPDVSAQKVQAIFRAKQARQELKQQQQSAAVLQKAMRGRAARKEVSDIRTRGAAGAAPAAAARAAGAHEPRVSGLLVQSESSRVTSIEDKGGAN